MHFDESDHEMSQYDDYIPKIVPPRLGMLALLLLMMILGIVSLFFK